MTPAFWIFLVIYLINLGAAYFLPTHRIILPKNAFYRNLSSVGQDELCPFVSLEELRKVSEKVEDKCHELAMINQEIVERQEILKESREQVRRRTRGQVR